MVLLQRRTMLYPDEITVELDCLSLVLDRLKSNQVGLSENAESQQILTQVLQWRWWKRSCRGRWWPRRRRAPRWHDPFYQVPPEKCNFSTRRFFMIIITQNGLDWRHHWPDHVNSSVFYLVYVDGPGDGSDEVDDCLYDVQDSEDPYPHPEDLSGCEGGINSQRYRINMKEKTQTHCPYVRSC